MLVAISAYVRTGVRGIVNPARCITVRRPAHSGQRMPTAAWVMHSAQIGRPHSEHETYVSRLGCR